MTARTEGAQLARNALMTYASRGALVLSAVLLTPYLFRRLGLPGFGTWSVMLTLTTIFTLLEFGVSAGAVRGVAAARAVGDNDLVRRTIRAATVVMTFAGVGGAAVAVVAAFALTPLAAAGEKGAFRDGMLVLAAAMLVRFPCTAYAATLNGYQRYDLSNLSLGLTTVGSGIGSVIAVEAGSGVFGLAVAHAIALVVGGALYAVLLARLRIPVSIRPGRVAWSEVSGLGRFSSYTLLADSMTFIGQRFDVVIIAAVRNAATAAPYAAAVKLQTGLQSLTLPVVDMLMPMMSDLWQRGERDEIARRLTLATRVTLQVTLPVAAGLALFADDISRLWLGADAPDVTATIIVVLMVVQTITLAAFAAEKTLIGIGRVRPIAVLAAVEGLANVALSVALTFRYGALGPALGTLASSGTLSPIRFALACRALHWPLGRFLRSGLAVAAISSLPALAVMLAIWLLVDGSTTRAIVGPLAGVAVAAAVGAIQLRTVRLRSLIRGLGGQRPPELPSELAAGSGSHTQ